MRRLAILVTLVAGLAACRGDRKRCEVACRNYATLVYPEQIQREAALLFPPDREAHIRKRMGQMPSFIENGVGVCIEQCSSSRNDDQIACMEQAKTAAVARTCTD